MQEKLNEFKEDLPVFIETAFIAIKQGDEKAAQALFKAVGLLDPGNPSEKMGYGLIALHKMDVKNATACFEEVLKKDKDNYRAEAFLAFAHLISTLKKGETNTHKQQALVKSTELAEHVLENCKEETTCQLAQSLLNWEKELMKQVSSGPVK